MQNINTFLEAAKKLGVAEADLFEPDDLYYALDFGVVLGCISELSLTKASQKAGGTKPPPIPFCPFLTDFIYVIKKKQGRERERGGGGGGGGGEGGRERESARTRICARSSS